MKDSKLVSLYIDTATKRLDLALKVGENVTKICLGDPKKALERTHLGIKLLLEQNGLSLKDVDCFYTLLGPGSNTGIRLGLTIPRTIYAFNPQIKLYGINTLKLMADKEGAAVLSDRGGNLFFGQKQEDGFKQERILKADISKMPKLSALVVEASDKAAIEELKDQNLVKVRVLDLMLENESEFKDFSADEEHYLPEYQLKI